MCLHEQTTEKSERRRRLEFLELRLRATTLLLIAYSTVCDRVYHVTACATSPSRRQNTPA